MATCFVIQPFDGGPFDLRYKETYEPAIQAAGLEPYRVDQDHGVSIPIENIEGGIRQARVCLAEITLDNPNVWFELGYAIACGKEVVLICADSRANKFPFDVQHRTIIKYSTGSASGFAELGLNITAKLKAYLEKAEALASVIDEMPQLVTQSTQGLSDHEVVMLAAIAANLDHEEDSVSVYVLRRDMEASGYTPLAATLAAKGLSNAGFLTSSRRSDEEGNEYFAYSLTTVGWSWIMANQSKFALQKPKSPGYGGASPRRAGY